MFHVAVHQIKEQVEQGPNERCGFVPMRSLGSIVYVCTGAAWSSSCPRWPRGRWLQPHEDSVWVHSTWHSPALGLAGASQKEPVTYHKGAIARHVVEMMTCAREHTKAIDFHVIPHLFSAALYSTVGMYPMPMHVADPSLGMGKKKNCLASAWVPIPLHLPTARFSDGTASMARDFIIFISEPRLQTAGACIHDVCLLECPVSPSFLLSSSANPSLEHTSCAELGPGLTFPVLTRVGANVSQ